MKIVAENTFFSVEERNRIIEFRNIFKKGFQQEKNVSF